MADDWFDDPDSDPLYAIAPWSLDIDHLVDFDAFRAASWAISDTLDRVQPDIRTDDAPINHAVRCLSCDQTGVEAMFDPDGLPPDPDRHGNRRWTYRCPGCGEKVTLLTARHGGTMVRTQGFELVD